MGVLLSSVKGLDCLLRVCEGYCTEWDIGLNAKKLRNLYFGKKTYDILLNGQKVERVDQWPYLGVTLKNGKTFDCSVTERIKKFYRWANSIFRIEGRSNNMVMLKLKEAHCIKILTYAVEVLHVANRDERRQLRVAYNSVFQRMFCYRWSQSVSALQSFLGRRTWEQVINKRRESFHTQICRASAESLAFVFLNWISSVPLHLLFFCATLLCVNRNIL